MWRCTGEYVEQSGFRVLSASTIPPVYADSPLALMRRYAAHSTLVDDGIEE